MAKHKVSELNGALLDAAVAMVEGWSPVDPEKARHAGLVTWQKGGVYEVGGNLDYSRDWALGGPIIERELLVIGPTEQAGEWVAYADGATISDHGSDTLTGSNTYGTGSTPLIAAMRAYVARKFGDTAELP